MCCAHLHPPPAPPPSLFFLNEVLSLFAMPKVDPRNEVGTIIHAVLNRVLSNHTAKNIYGNVNYAKTFLQGTVINVFDGHTPGGENAVWKLTVDFEVHSKAYARSRIKEGRRPSAELHPWAGSGR
jgi:hypothetical protein